MKYIIPAIRFKIFMTILLGLIYPLAMTGFGQSIFHQKVNGDLLSRGGQLVGSKLIGQKFESEKYFWSRPSAVDYNPLASGGSNLGPTSQDLKKAVDERILKLKAVHSGKLGEPPQDLVFASGSGLDPHISLEAADYQAARVAQARGLDMKQVIFLIEQSTEQKSLGFIGEATVNVLSLNLALDKSQGIEAAPTLVPTSTGEKK